jgi:hypothetical protein
MRGQNHRSVYQSLATVAALGILLVSSAHAESADSGQSAVWAHKEFQFTYQGFTTHYSCDGLRDKVRQILLQFGARKDDLKIYDFGCASPSGRPDPFPSVSVKMSVLVPADSAAASGAGPQLPSHWQPVRLKLDQSSLAEAGECELVEQVKQKVLPLFTARNVDLQNFCIPHQLEPGGTHLVAEVLMPDQVQARAK